MIDFIVVGQGLAGSAPAWALLEHGATVAIVKGALWAPSLAQQLARRLVHDASSRIVA